MKLTSLFHVMTILFALEGCGSAPAPQSAVDTTGASAPPTSAAPIANAAPPIAATPVADAATGAKEGQSCGDGALGRPNIGCEPGLVCKNPSSTAPVGPVGSSSAIPGTCRKP